MTIGTGSGWTLYIGTTAIPANINTLDDTAARLEFEADSYIAVGEIEDMGEFGDESETVTFTSLSDGRVRKLKGPRDSGVLSLVVGDDMSDSGQAAMDAAEAATLDYNFKIVGNDAVTLGGTDSVHYLYAKVMSRRRNVGQANNVVRKTYAVGINSRIVESDPT